MIRPLLSTATVAIVGLTCKAAFNIGFTTATVKGLPILLDALADPRRNHGQGIVTVSNHISTLDDPVAWGVLPSRCFLSTRTTRWALGASEIMFTNPLFSTFFRLGQTLETFRGKGVNQRAVDVAIEKLDRGNWVHLYCEGKVNQPHVYPKDGSGVAHLPRFKWGVGRMLMEAAVPPIVIPMWLTGFNHLMPEGRSFPYKYFPRPGTQLSVTFGDPVPGERIQQALRALGKNTQTSFHSLTSDHKSPTHWMANVTQHDTAGTSLSSEILQVRAEVTGIVQNTVEALGRSVCGESLSSQGTEWTKNQHVSR